MNSRRDFLKALSTLPGLKFIRPPEETDFDDNGQAVLHLSHPVTIKDDAGTEIIPSGSVYAYDLVQNETVRFNDIVDRPRFGLPQTTLNLNVECSAMDTVKGLYKLYSTREPCNVTITLHSNDAIYGDIKIFQGRVLFTTLEIDGSPNVSYMATLHGVMVQ